MRAARTAPEAIGPPLDTTRAVTSVVPTCRWTRARGPSDVAPSSRCTSARSRVLGAHASPPTITAPRATCATSTPASASAARAPARASSSAAPWPSMPRTRASIALGRMRTVASRATAPLHTVPVTTVPVPLTVKLRSTGRRNGASTSRAPPDVSTRASARRRSSSPAPVLAETGTMALSASAVPASRARTSSATSAHHSSSTRSALVRATTPRGTPSKSRIARCSRVWGMIPSSAATTSSAASMPVAPASIVRTNPSCPGTSTTPTAPTPGSSRRAKPSSMVMPRRFSSGRRSVSTPVSACTRAVLPWSM